MRYEDEIYHSGYSDGYYASMALCHADGFERMSDKTDRIVNKFKRPRK